MKLTGNTGQQMQQILDRLRSLEARVAELEDREDEVVAPAARALAARLAATP